MKTFQKNVRLSIWISIMKVKQFWLKSHGKEFENCIIIEYIKYTIHVNEEEGKKRGKEMRQKLRGDIKSTIQTVLDITLVVLLSA